jgi:hypothetical protein
MNDKNFEILKRVVIYWTIFAALYSFLMILFSERAAKVLFNNFISKRTFEWNIAYNSASAENKTIIENEIKESNKKSFEQFILVSNGFGG